MSEETAPRPDEEAALSPRTKVIAVVVAVLLLSTAAYVMLRVSSPPILPTQLPPANHYSGSCEWCHARTTDARPIEVRR